MGVAEGAGLMATASKNGDLMVWSLEQEVHAESISLPWQNRWSEEVHLLDRASLLRLTTEMPPEWIDLAGDGQVRPVPGLESSPVSPALYESSLLCRWDGLGRMLVDQWDKGRFLEVGSIPLGSSQPPRVFAYHPAGQLLAWTLADQATTVFLANLAAPGRRIELQGDLPIHHLRFNSTGTLLAGMGEGNSGGKWMGLRAWNVQTGQVLASIDGSLDDALFADENRTLVVSARVFENHEIQFHDLARPDNPPQRFPGRNNATFLALSPDNRLVVAATLGGELRLFKPEGTSLGSLHGHLNAVHSCAFSPDGRRLITTCFGREAVKLWDVETRQELLTLEADFSGRGFWSGDGDFIIFAPGRAWRAPSWETIAAAEN
jgi:WD40 repeat protein